jgi:hypothetical protein
MEEPIDGPALRVLGPNEKDAISTADSERPNALQARFLFNLERIFVGAIDEVPNGFVNGVLNRGW